MVKTCGVCLFSKTTLAAPIVIAALLCSIGLTSCGETSQPDYVVTATLKGSPYERGLLHGQLFGNRIRSFYTTMLSHSLMPYLNRERPDVASILLNYQSTSEGNADSYYQAWRDNCLKTCKDSCDEYCGFSYLLMRDSAESLKRYIPQEYLDEMQGIADGSGLSFERVLILNTFFDTLMAFRSISYYIRQAQSPMLIQLEFFGAADDGVDNDGDGLTDEPGEGLFATYEPSPTATLVEVPADKPIRLRLHDIKLGIGTDKGDTPGVDPDTIRIRHNETQYQYPLDEGIITVLPVPEDPQALDVEFLPPGGFELASVQTLLVQAGDFNRIENPPPIRARFMRDERITFSTVGYGAKISDIHNQGYADGQTQPPSIAFAASGAATSDGQPFLAHHFALLDSNTAHKHTALLVHVPDNGENPHVTLGYTGLVWGLSGMNSKGLAWAFNTSDTLDNSMVNAFMRDMFETKLVCSGAPIGIIGRDILTRHDTVDEAVDTLKRIRPSFGWNLLLADAGGDMAAIELDWDLERHGGTYVIEPTEEADDRGYLGGKSGNDLYIGSHYIKNLNDLTTKVLIFQVRPQRYWSSFYFRSVRARSILGTNIENNIGQLNVDKAIEIMQVPDLIDERDSMISAVFEPKTLKINYAMGEVPALNSGFVEFSFADLLGGQ